MKSNWIKISITFIFLLGLSVPSWAAETDPYAFQGMAEWMYLAIVGIVVIAALISLFNMMLMYFDTRATQMLKASGQYVEKKHVARKSLWTKLYERATQYVPAEKERDILLDHNYDGIQELDNNLPPWWLWMFYISIAFSVVYVAVYHFSPWKESNIEEYHKDLAKAEAEIKAYKALAGDKVDENNLEVMVDEKDLALGKANFINLCAACHRPDGGGSVGPNLTDDYWVHGGSISDIYKTIKYGVPEKGMISWKTQLRPTQMHQLSSYIMTLHGTNPVDPKDPQGEIYVAKEE